MDTIVYKQDMSGYFGKSLPVSNVQEMAKNEPQSIPQKYILQQKDSPIVVRDMELSSFNIPIIDLSLLAKGDEDERRKLDLACKDWGFFQIVNHGVDEEVLLKMKAVIAAFFELPLEEKNKYAQAENDLEGYGHAYVVSEEQTLDWSDMVFLFTLPPEIRNLKYWPNTLPGFMDAIERYSKEAQKVGEEICANISLLMGMDTDSRKRFYKNTKQGMRMNYYPPCSRPDLVLGLSPHSDPNIITLLLQDDEVPGLQIKHNDEWILVKPMRNALVVNVGDVIEIMSNGVYKSIEHRAITNESKARISLATVINPEDEVEVGPLESMVDDHRPQLYRNIKFLDYIRYSLARKMEGKAQFDDILKI